VTSVPIRIDSGTCVGPYVVDRRLGLGKTGSLYLARDADGRRLVLKTVLPDLATGAARARLQREARALAAVDHPAVVRVHGVGDHEGMSWIAMDYVQGTDLKRVLAERQRLSVGVALGYAIDAAEGLVAAHDAGVIHRDIKPSNLILTPEGRIVLVDFGITRRRIDVRDDGTSPRLTPPPSPDVPSAPPGRWHLSTFDPAAFAGRSVGASGAWSTPDRQHLEEAPTSLREASGTLAYLSPEQIEHGLADERSDVWGLGCVLHELVVGVPPFGDDDHVSVAAILRDEPRLATHLSGAIVHVVSACLRKSSFARVASPRELLVLLRDALEDPTSGLAAGSERPPSRASGRPSARSSAPPGARAPSRVSAPSSTAPPSLRSSPAFHTSRGSLSRTSTSLPGVPPSSSTRIAVTRGRVKGTALRPALAWFAQMYGEGAVARVAKQASPELSAMLRLDDPALGIIASGWYDTQLIGELIGLIGFVARPVDPAAFDWHIAEAVAKDNVEGVYRSLFRLVASPRLLEANAQRVWRTYFDEGTLSVQLIGKRSFLAYVRGWSRHHAEVCRMLQPLLACLLRAAGYSELRMQRTACIDGGNTQCMFEGTWTP